MKQILTKEQLVKLADAVDTTNTYVRFYSSRGMRPDGTLIGEKCFGIVPNTDTARYFSYLAEILIENEEEEILDLILENPSEEATAVTPDGDTIVYFPNLLVGQLANPFDEYRRPDGSLAR